MRVFERQPIERRGKYDTLEWLAGVVLAAVLAALAWMLVVSYWPKSKWLRLPTLEAEILIVLALLTLGLVLVTVVALLNTRRS